MAFYNQFIDLKDKLEESGHIVLYPELEFKTDNSDDTSVGAYIDKQGGIDNLPLDHLFWKKKGDAILRHFKKIDESDCILVTNYEKKGIPNYIGGNTFLEIGYSFGKGKKIFILNELPKEKESAYKEEIMGMQPIILNGDINKIK